MGGGIQVEREPEWLAVGRRDQRRDQVGEREPEWLAVGRRDQRRDPEWLATQNLHTCCYMEIRDTVVVYKEVPSHTHTHTH